MINEFKTSDEGVTTRNKLYCRLSEQKININNSIFDKINFENNL